MVGTDPYTCTGSNCSVTIEVDVTPIVVNIDGMTFSGQDVYDGTLDSPLFTDNDYGATAFATNSSYALGSGGALSEPTQGPSLNVGRYTFMGDLNPFAGFRQPATGC